MRHDPLEIARLVSGYIHQTLSAEEEKAFLELLRQDEEVKQLLESYRDVSQIESRLTSMQRHDATAAWERFQDKKIKKKKQRPWRSWLAAAAAVIFLLCVGLWYIKRDDRIVPDKTHRYANDVLPGESQAKLLLSDGSSVILSDAAIHLSEKNGISMKGDSGELIYNSSVTEKSADLLFNTLEVPKGGMYKITLADGTRAWVNASSTLSFPVNFASDERKIKLMGEAYFEVAKDNSRPFKVVINNTEITVLGTSFNVTGYTEATVTTLIDGAVKVSQAEQMSNLKPGEQAVASNGNIKVGIADIEKAIAWKDGYFLFNEDRLKPILEELARWYDLELVFKNEVPNVHIGGSISRKENLSEVLEMLKDVSGLNFSIDRRKLIVNAALN